MFAHLGGGTATPERGLFFNAGSLSIRNLLIENTAAPGRHRQRRLL